MIYYNEQITVLTQVGTTSDSQGGVVESWAAVRRLLFDPDTAVGVLSAGDEVTGSVGGGTALIVEIDYTSAIIDYALLTTPDFVLDETLGDDDEVQNSITICDVAIGAMLSIFKARLSKLGGAELILAGKVMERSTHILYTPPNKLITTKNRIQAGSDLYEVLSVVPAKNPIGQAKHWEIQLELLE